jgi:hypothetical protein
MRQPLPQRAQGGTVQTHRGGPGITVGTTLYPKWGSRCQTRPTAGPQPRPCPDLPGPGPNPPPRPYD